MKNDSLATEGDITSNYLRVKALGAFNILDKSNFKFRINAGPSYDFLLSSKDKDGNDVKDQLNSGSFNIQGGIGVDIWILTADVGYSYSFTNVFKNEDFAPDSKLAGLYFTVGVIFGSGKGDTSK
ncbi:MAG TPA: outer membrane beta-barrel protein [Bacteroidia bacterium]|nr:outer membrane beta-barrel protein [Bacteroidia bacterium]